MKEKPIQFLPNKMRFVGLTTPGGPNNLSIMAAPIPLPTDTELLIKVHASGVNGADLREREGMYRVPADAPDIMGLEVAGEVIVVGKSCKRFKPGDFVCALLIGGGYAEYAIAPEGQCMTIPDGVSVVDAAGLPEVFCTVWTNMMDRCQLKSGETVLVQGGTSGIGFATIKVAKAFGAGAHMVMIGGMLAGHDESEQEVVDGLMVASEGYMSVNWTGADGNKYFNYSSYDVSDGTVSVEILNHSLDQYIGAKFKLIQNQSHIMINLYLSNYPITFLNYLCSILSSLCHTQVSGLYCCLYLCMIYLMSKHPTFDHPNQQ